MSETLDQSDEERDLKILKSHTAQLMEHFETVQILCSRHIGDDGTVSCTWGSGNWFARYGQVKEWITKQEEGTRIERRNEDA